MPGLGTWRRWDGTGWVPSASGAEAVGGLAVDVGLYRVHSFFGDGNLTVTKRGVLEYLIVAGGGSGSSGTAGGGGGGGVLHNIGLPIQMEVGVYPIDVGLGGVAPSGTQMIGNNGQNSSAFDLTALGGGRGGMTSGVGLPAGGLDGGSGGGGSNYGGQNMPPGFGLAGQGYDGAYAPDSGGGGGGGAGGPGNGRHGGPGLLLDITGASVYYGGGGGGGQEGVGGLGGGGDGNTNAGEAGTPNTGGGGGGGWSYAGGIGGAGGSGIVIVRYLL